MGANQLEEREADLKGWIPDIPPEKKLAMLQAEMDEIKKTLDYEDE